MQPAYATANINIFFLNGANSSIDDQGGGLTLGFKQLLAELTKTGTDYKPFIFSDRSVIAAKKGKKAPALVILASKIDLWDYFITLEKTEKNKYV